jgi:hypothetical protein
MAMAGGIIGAPRDGGVMAILLRIQHPVPNFEGWKKAFDSDPMDRKGAGVRRFQIHRSVTDPNFVMIDLEFESRVRADEMLKKLRNLWVGPGKAVMQNPEAWIVETIESQTL